MSNDNRDEDLEYVRKKYYSVSETYDEAIQQALDLALSSDSPRAYEVLSNMLKQNTEVMDKLVELHKSKKALTEEKKEPGFLPSGTTNNNLFVGTTADMLDMLEAKEASHKKKSQTIDNE